jgi:hypothetical protein
VTIASSDVLHSRVLDCHSCSPLLTLRQRHSFDSSTIGETTMEDVTYVSSRSIDIELGGQEVITIDLDNLDPNPDDVLDLLKEGQCRVSVWTKLAGEYWRRGYLAAAERIAHSAIECASPSSSPSYNSPKCIHSITCKRNNSFISSDIRTSRKYSDSSCSKGPQIGAVRSS